MASQEIMAQNIRKLRKKHGHTQQDLGKQLSVDKMTVSGWETCKKEPSFEMLDRIAEIYSVSVPELFSSGEEPVFPAIAKKQSEFFQCLCALAASPYVDFVELNPVEAENEDRWTFTVGQNIVLGLYNVNDNRRSYETDARLLDRCTAGIALAKAYKTRTLTDSIFESAVRGVVANISAAENDLQSSPDDDDGLPF